MMERLRFLPLGRFGAMVEGFDFDAMADETIARRLRHALAVFQLLLLRGRPISPHEQLCLTRLFGDLEPSIARRPAHHQVAGFPELLNVRNTADSPTLEYGFGWHSDGLAYARRPHGATVLQCVDCPPGVGDTLFADQYGAYNDLADPWRERLEGRSWYLPPIPHSEVPPGRGLVQPFYRRHPSTGRRFLYFAPHATQVRGMTHGESTVLLAVVRASQVRDGFVYRHAWRPGDVIVWENCALLHNRADAVDFTTQGLRTMYRSATVGHFEAQECEAAPTEE